MKSNIDSSSRVDTVPVDAFKALWEGIKLRRLPQSHRSIGCNIRNLENCIVERIRLAGPLTSSVLIRRFPKPRKEDRAVSVRLVWLTTKVMMLLRLNKVSISRTRVISWAKMGYRRLLIIDQVLSGRNQPPN